MQVARLERRVLHLERKLVVWASRMKKEVIWRKFLEDWILQKFNFDLRLQVELKTLEDDGVDEFEKEERSNSSSADNVFSSGTYASSSTSSRSTSNPNIQVQRSSQSFSSNTRQVINQRMSGRGRQIQLSTRGTSMSTQVGPSGDDNNADLSASGSQNQNSTNITRNVSITVVNRGNNSSNASSGSTQGQGSYLSPQGKQHQVQQSHRLFIGNSPQKLTGLGSKRLQLNVSPGKRLRRLQQSTSPSHPIIVSTSSMASASGNSNSQLNQTETTSSTVLLIPSASNASASSGNNVQQPEVILLDDDDDEEGPREPSLPQNLNSNSNSVSSSTAQSQQLFVENSISNPTNVNHVVHLPHQVNPIQQLQQLSFHPVTSTNSIITREEHYPDSSIQNADFSRNLIHEEASFVAGGYLRRYGEQNDKIAFDVKKILHLQDPFITDHILLEIINTQNMSLQAKKNITSALGDFLMTVYGESPPRIAKESMAESLESFFPFVPKETWWNKLPNKNPSGCLEHRIQNKRRHMVDERRRQQLSTAEGKVTMPNNPTQGSVS